MLAFLVTGRGSGSVQEVPAPVAGPGQVVIDVHRVGVCGTDLGLFDADEARLQHARTGYPLRLGHEWVGTVTGYGSGVDPSWLSRRVTGDTMLGCGVCERCRKGQHHVCEDRYEVGVRGGWPGALAERLLMPAVALHALPDSVDDTTGALVEPGANAYRAVSEAAAGAGSRLLVLGPGTIGLLCAQFGRARGAEVHVLGPTGSSLDLARRLGIAGAWTADNLPSLAWDAVIDATNGDQMPSFAAEVVEPAGRIVYIGISAGPSLVDSRTLVRKGVTAVGVLGGSSALAPTIDAFASGAVDPSPLVKETVGLDVVSEVLSGRRWPTEGGPPKTHVDPQLPTRVRSTAKNQ
ncbi:MAG TPA: alcohol dehydrogenase catalytic domain-containing protein [Propionibacteriaceae bacterium]